MQNSKPLVSIGMPVYNEVKYIRQALDLLLAQSFKEFELVISDNASTDGTWSILQDYAAQDPRIFLHRQSENRGSAANFQFVLNQARGEYFMWASGHDLWYPTFISCCVEIMENDPNVILCYSRTMRIDPDSNSIGPASNQIDTRGMSPVARFRHLIWNIVGGDLIYGVIRTQALEQIPEIKCLWGPDLAMLAELSLKGTFAQVNEALFYWRKIRDESLEFQKRTTPLMIDPINGQKMLKMELPELWRELGHEFLSAIDRSSLTYSSKMILKSNTMWCFKIRFGVQWPRSALKYLGIFNIEVLLSIIKSTYKILKNAYSRVKRGICSKNRNGK